MFAVHLLKCWADIYLMLPGVGGAVVLLRLLYSSWVFVGDTIVCCAAIYQMVQGV